MIVYFFLGLSTFLPFQPWQPRDLPIENMLVFLLKRLAKDRFLTGNNMLILSLLYTLSSRDGNIDRGTWLNGTVIGHAAPKSFLWQDRVLVGPSRAASRADVLSERQSR